MQDYSKATIEDVAEITRTVKALRALARTSKTSTTRTQSAILRQLSPEVLAAVAVELDTSYSAMSTVLSGQKPEAR